MSTVTERILLLMEKHHMSYGTLAEATGISKSTLQRYATGVTDKIPFERIVKIASALGVSPAYLADGEEMPQARTQEEKKILLLARKAADIPAAQREKLIRHFEDTIEIYLEAKGNLKED